MELAADLTPDGLREVLAELGDRVAPTALARERTLSVHPALSALFPDGGLVRGSVLACSGGGATTCALAMVREALVEGAWMAIVDVPTFGPDAANELGVPLERLVRVDATSGSDEGTDADDDQTVRVQRWFDAMGAAIDGFDVVLVGVPAGLRGERRPAALRALMARLQQRGAVVVVVGPTGVLPIDITYSSTVAWGGLGQGHGIIRQRRLDVIAAGRRQPQRVSIGVDLDVVGRRIVLAAAAPVESQAVDSSAELVVVPDAVESSDPQAVVLAEMIASVPEGSADDSPEPDDAMHLAAG